MTRRTLTPLIIGGTLAIIGLLILFRGMYLSDHHDSASAETLYIISLFPILGGGSFLGVGFYRYSKENTRPSQRKTFAA